VACITCVKAKGGHFEHNYIVYTVPGAYCWFSSQDNVIRFCDWVDYDWWVDFRAYINFIRQRTRSETSRQAKQIQRSHDMAL